MSERPPVEETIDWLTSRGNYANQITDRRVIPGSDASHADIDVHRAVASALTFQDIPNLYQHQADAIQAVRSGQNVVLATPTASGKSLAYTVPALERAITDGKKTLYIAPQRALISDQYETLSEYASTLGFGADVSVAKKTGRTSRSEDRQTRRTQPDILLATIDQVHLSFLHYAHSPNHWRWLFQQLDTVVIDEVHQYRGNFGTHTGLVFRRFNRLLDFYDSDPEFICCSATIGNPVDHAATVTGQPADTFTLVDDDTSATGDRHWIVWNPPLRKERSTDPLSGPSDGTQQAEQDDADDSVTAASPDGGTPVAGAPPDTADSGGPSIDDKPQTAPEYDGDENGERRSQHAEAVRLFCDLTMRGYQTLAFTRARQGTEQYARWARNMLKKRGKADLARQVHAYHGALETTDRTAIEAKLADGDARGVWATNALELGIDIGSLDVVLLDGYPGTIMETFQRTGRAGRGNDDCLLVLVGGDNPLDQYMVSHPDELFDGDPERATLNPANKTVQKDHLVCAAADHYLAPDDEAYFEGETPATVTALEDQGRLQRTDEAKVRWEATEDSPRWNTDIRNIDETTISLVDRYTGEQLGTLSLDEALRDVHPEAIYTYRGEPYQVEELRIDDREARLKQVDTNAYTRALREKKVRINETLETGTVSLPGGSDSTDREYPQLQKTLADLSVEAHYDDYLYYTHPSDDEPEERPMPEELPAHTIETRGLFLEMPASMSTVAKPAAAATGPDDETYLSALHAIEHTVISLFPRVVLCDRGDIGGLSIERHRGTTGGTIFVHDAYDGGTGYSRAAYDRLGELLERAAQTIQTCNCDDGCPSCVQSPQCGNANRTLSKPLAKRVLAACGFGQ